MMSDAVFVVPGCPGIRCCKVVVVLAAIGVVEMVSGAARW